MITEGMLEELGLPTYENGYYNITDEITVDVEGTIRFEYHDFGRMFIAQIYSLEDLKVFIKGMTAL